MWDTVCTAPETDAEACGAKQMECKAIPLMKVFLVRSTAIEIADDRTENE